MKTGHALAVVTLVAAGSLLAACGGDSGCPTETPRIDGLQSCTAQPGATVSVKVRVCPTCNLTNVSCDVDLSGVANGTIFLDPVAERCEGSSSCPPSCATDEVVCTFTAPSTPGLYHLQVSTAAGPQVQDLDVVAASGPVACAF